MRELSIADLVCLALDEGSDDSSDPPGRSVADLREVLGIGARFAGSIELVAGLRTCLEAALVTRTHDSPRRSEGSIHVALTDEGRTRAAALRESLADETVELHRDGERRAVRVADLPLERPDVPLARALAHCSADGVVRLPDPTADPVVNREEALGTLSEAFDGLRDGDGGAILVTGKHGIGKTALLDRAVSLAADRDFETVAGSGSGSGGEPYRAFRTALESRRAVLPDRLFEGAGFTDGGKLRHRRRSFFAEVAGALSGLASDRPLVLAIDDLGRADRGTVALFASLASALADEPVCLLGAVEPDALDGDSPLGTLAEAEGPATVLDLDGLDRAATGALLERLLGDPDLPGAFVEQLHGHTGGNPLFLEESVSYMRDRGTVDPRTGEYPTKSADLDVPDRIQTATLERIETLDEATREILTWGSVIGETVSVPVLAAVVDRDEDDLGAAVDRLVEVNIWDRAGPDTVQFTSGLVARVIQDRLDGADRRERHRAVADDLERVDDGDAASHVADAAAHYAEAELTDPAIDCYRLAAEEATAVYAFETALEAYESALSVAREADRTETALQLREKIGVVRFQSEGYDDADRSFRYVRERTDDPEANRRVAAFQARIRKDRGELEATVDIVDEVLADWDGETTSRSICDLRNRKAWAVSQLGEVETARSLANEALSMAETLDEQDLAASAHRTLGVLEYQYGDINQAVDAYDRSLEAARASGNRRGIARAYNNLGGAFQLLGELEASLEHFQRSREFYDRIDNRVKGAIPLGNEGLINIRLGNLERAGDRIEAATDRARRLDLNVFLLYLGNFRALLALVTGDIDAAGIELEETLADAREMGHDRIRTQAHVTLSRVRRLQDAPESAMEHVECVLELADADETSTWSEAQYRGGQLRREAGEVETAIECHRDELQAHSEGDSWEVAAWHRMGLAAALVAADRASEAREHAEAALESAEDTGDRLVTITATRRLAEVRHALGDTDRTLELLADAAATASEIGADTYEAGVHLTRGEILADSGATERAGEELAAARDLADGAGCKLFERRAESALSDLPAAGK